MAKRFADFKIQESQKDSKKITSTWLNVWTSWAENKNFETNLLAYEAKQVDEKLQKFFALHEFLRLYYKQIAWFECDICHKYHS